MTRAGAYLAAQGANLSGLPLIPRRHDLAAFILNPVLCARRKLFESPLDRRGLLHGCVPRPFIWHGLYVAVFSTTGYEIASLPPFSVLLHPCPVLPRLHHRRRGRCELRLVSAMISVLHQDPGWYDHLVPQTEAQMRRD